MQPQGQLQLDIFPLLESNDLPNDYWLIIRFGTAAFFTIKTGDY
jgi:hypothetical protein